MSQENVSMNWLYSWLMVKRYGVLSGAECNTQSKQNHTPLHSITVVDVILLHPGRYSATAKFLPFWALRSKTTHGTQILFYIKTRSPLDSFASHNICNSFFLSNDITGSKSWDDFLAKSAFFSHICSLLKEHQSKKAQRKNLVHVTF